MNHTRRSETFDRCLWRAKQLNEDLFPCDCMTILEAEYKGRINNMKPVALRSMIAQMMCVLDADCDYSDEISEAVENFMQTPFVAKWEKPVL